MTNSTDSEELRKAQEALKQAQTRVHILQKELDKILLADVKTVSIPCTECTGTGEDFWGDEGDCTECGGTGYSSVPLFTEKKDYSAAYDLIDTLFDGE